MPAVGIRRQVNVVREVDPPAEGDSDGCPFIPDFGSDSVVGWLYKYNGVRVRLVRGGLQIGGAGGWVNGENGWRWRYIPLW